MIVSVPRGKCDRLSMGMICARAAAGPSKMASSAAPASAVASPLLQRISIVTAPWIRTAPADVRKVYPVRAGLREPPAANPGKPGRSAD